MPVRILQTESTDRFIGSPSEPLQVLRVRIAGRGVHAGPATVSFAGNGARGQIRLDAGAEECVAEVGIDAGSLPAGTPVTGEVTVADRSGSATAMATLVVAEPGWRLHIVPHFHFDPVFWNTQNAYVERWQTGDAPWEDEFQRPGLDLVAAHLAKAEADPGYCFVLAELDYLEPYWNLHPEHRSLIRRLIAQRRLELVGGSYNEPDTNLSGPETIRRSFEYGTAFARDVIGARPRIAWQLDVFGHAPHYPAAAAAAGLRAAVFARGPHHAWGPWWYKHADQTLSPPPGAGGPPPDMQIPTEFEWLAPDGSGVIGAYLASHYHAGWWIDRAADLDEAQRMALELFDRLKPYAATRNVLLPIGTDYSPPNRWVPELARAWNARYVWPRIVCTVPSAFFAAVEDDLAASGRALWPQTRDLNPIFTGTQVTSIESKQAHRQAERAVLNAETMAVLAELNGLPLGGLDRAELDKAWRQLLFCAHHDGVTGSHSGQVHIDLLTAWRDAAELAGSVQSRALTALAPAAGREEAGLSLVIANPASWQRTDLATVQFRLPDGAAAVRVVDDQGDAVPHVVEVLGPPGEPAADIVVTVLVADLPGFGVRTYRCLPLESLQAAATWQPVRSGTMSTDRFEVVLDPARGGAVSAITDLADGAPVLRPGGLADELLAFGEYAEHPAFEEGQWHISPDGRPPVSSAGTAARTRIERCALGSRAQVQSRFLGGLRGQQVMLWHAIDRIEFAAQLSVPPGERRQVRVRAQTNSPGAMPLCETGGGVIARGFGLPGTDAATIRSTLDTPAGLWCGLGVALRVEIAQDDADRMAAEPAPVAATAAAGSVAIATAELVVGDGDDVTRADRGLLLALARRGVTATRTAAGGPRYGTPDLDSNLPDVRIVAAVLGQHAFADRILAALGPAWLRHVTRSIAGFGHTRVWIPPAAELPALCEPNVDRRGDRDLPVLLIVAQDAPALASAIDAAAADVARGVVEIRQPKALAAGAGLVTDRSVALLNRGTPGWTARPDGDLFLSLQRTGGGWPAGVWPEGPPRTGPDGTSFLAPGSTQSFEWALCTGRGDWRAAGIDRAAREYAAPFVAMVLDQPRAAMAANRPPLTVSPGSVVVSALKPRGPYIGPPAGHVADASGEICVRLTETHGEPARARIRLRDGIARAEIVDVHGKYERPVDGVAPDRDEAWVDLGPWQTVSVAISPRTRVAGTDTAGTGRERFEPAAAPYSRWWRHNRGAAPIGNQPLSIFAAPDLVATAGEFGVDVVVSATYRDAGTRGTVTASLPPGWRLAPAGPLAFDLGSDGYLRTRLTVLPDSTAQAGRYWVRLAARGESGECSEEVLTVDLGRPGGDSGATRDAAAVPVISARWAGDHLVAHVGERAAALLEVVNTGRGTAVAEIEFVAPWAAWHLIPRWWRRLTLAAGETRPLPVTLARPLPRHQGTYWLLAKLTHAGTSFYSDSLPVTVL
jgi:hypothetical protein